MKKKRTRVKSYKRRKPNGGVTTVSEHTRYIKAISVPKDYTKVHIIGDKTYEYCEDGQFYDEGRLIADDVVAPNDTSTDDVEELFEKKVGDRFEYLHAQKRKADAEWKGMSAAKRKEWLISVGHPKKYATKEWKDLPDEFKMIKKFDVYGVPENDVPKPAGKCGPPCKGCKL